MCPRDVKIIVQDSKQIVSKPHWHEALRLARKELRQVESRAKALRKTIPVFEKLARERKVIAVPATL
jgi:hypothetical protein